MPGLTEVLSLTISSSSDIGNSSLAGQVRQQYNRTHQTIGSSVNLGSETDMTNALYVASNGFTPNSKLTLAQNLALIAIAKSHSTNDGKPSYTH